MKHPADPKTGDPIVMTTDFLLTVDMGQGVFEVARTIKMKDELLKEQVLEKFALQSKFPKGFLVKYESTIDVEDEYNWLKVITRNLKRHVNPFRHLLMLYFLEQDVDSFLQVEADTGPFGSGPWPCLNKAANHYKEFVIPEVNVTRDFI
nr:TnsD family Tn7-like transposition protein [Bacillus safensis]